MRRFIVLGALMILAACTTARTVAGRFDNYDEVLDGRMKSNLLGGRRISVQSPNADLQCSGRMRVTENGKSMFSWFSCAGDVGGIEFTCSDGRTASAIFTMANCKRGYGAGRDSTGAQLRFVFGMSEAEAAVYLDRGVPASRPNR